MSKKSIKVGNIVLVKNDLGEAKIARVLNVSRSSESVIVMYLDSDFSDLYMDTVSLLNCSLYENRKVE